jgi:tRNA modification GTPase
MLYQQQIIVAKATASGVGALSVVRISGPQAMELLAVLTGRPSEEIGSHRLKLRQIISDEKVIDEALVAVFKGPHSFTGEDVVELYLHGSDFISTAVMTELLKAGARLADAGEFTMRAYLNGKMDLAQAEAVADLIAAQSAGAHQLAINQLKGGVSEKIATLRGSLLEFAALVELELDFGEEDVEFADRKRLKQMLEGLQDEVNRLLHSFKSGNAIKEGIPVAIVGRPNAGKSTLLNAILGEERAIVTDIPGTTRDTIEEFFLSDGLKYRLIDTAGIREATDEVEALGIDRTFASAGKAALVWLVFDAASEDTSDLENTLEQIRSRSEAEIWLLANKSDLAAEKRNSFPDDTLRISAKNKILEPLFNKLGDYSKHVLAEASDTTISNLRHFEVLQNAKKELENVLMAIEKKETSDLLAFQLRQAMAELGKITGAIDSEDILGEIFSKFCIGK